MEREEKEAMALSMAMVKINQTTETKIYDTMINEAEKIVSFVLNAHTFYAHVSTFIIIRSMNTEVM